MKLRTVAAVPGEKAAEGGYAMLYRYVAVLFLIGIISVGSVSLTAPARAETLVGSNVDNRITVGLRVGEAALQSWLPAPWQINPPAKGPFKEANLFVVFIDRLLNQDAEGKPAAGGTFRAMALAVPAKHPQTGKAAPFVTRVFIPHEPALYNPYKNSVKATIRRESTLKGANLEPGTGSELWEVRDSVGGVLEFRMQYQRVVPSRAKREMTPYSAAEPNLLPNLPVRAARGRGQERPGWYRPGARL